MLLLLSLLLYLDHAICNRYVNSCDYIHSYYQQLKNNGHQNNELSPLVSHEVAHSRQLFQFCPELVLAVPLMFRIPLQFIPPQDELKMALKLRKPLYRAQSPINKPMCSFVIYVNKKCDGRLGRKGSITGVCYGRGLDLASLFVKNQKKKEKKQQH